MRLAVTLVFLVCVLLWFASHRAAAGGETEPRWWSTGIVPGASSYVDSLVVWDPDGEGPEPAQLIAGGVFTEAGGVTANRIARWDGVTWRPLGAGMWQEVKALTVWDPDGDGPEPPQLIAGGDFTIADDVRVNRVARWDGSSWRPLGTGLNSAVYALTVWDPDGDGPKRPQLIAGGMFTTAGDVTVNFVARWDGVTWRPLGTGMNTAVMALTVWDPDGDGPEAPQLIAGGDFTTAGGVTVNRVARWDGSAWHSLGMGLDTGYVSTLTVWDSDGDGPRRPQLIAGGRFTSASGVSVNHVARWEGSVWTPLGEGLSDRVNALTTWDPDGDGPEPSRLIAAGNFTLADVKESFIAHWDGAAWSPVGTGFIDWVSTLTTWDPDGDGPEAAYLVAGGRFTTVGGVPVNHVAGWNGTAWHPFGAGIDLKVTALTVWDPDGEGLEPAQLIAGGEFTGAGGVTLNYVARWNGSAWLPLGTGMNNPVLALAVWDSDGDGPAKPQLIAGGTFTTAGGEAVNYVAQWDGSEWRSLGTGTDSAVYTLTVWDPDGDGPAKTQLIAGGAFTTAGGVLVNRVARWDGSQWHALGTGTNGPVRASTVWDPDGDGPKPPQLILGGWFTIAGGIAVNRVAGWDGSQWRPLGTGMKSRVMALTVWDPDGDGPKPPQLIAGSEFITTSGVTANRVARWDGSQWRPLGNEMDNQVWALTVWDPDGGGPKPPQLIAGGAFTTAGGKAANYIARWQGSAWQPLGTGMNFAVAALMTWDPDGTGPAPPRLIAGGNFTTAGDVPTGFVSLWGTVD